MRTNSSTWATRTGITSGWRRLSRRSPSRASRRVPTLPRPGWELSPMTAAKRSTDILASWLAHLLIFLMKAPEAAGKTLFKIAVNLLENKRMKNLWQVCQQEKVYRVYLIKARINTLYSPISPSQKLWRISKRMTLKSSRVEIGVTRIHLTCMVEGHLQKEQDNTWKGLSIQLLVT